MKKAKADHLMKGTDWWRSALANYGPRKLTDGEEGPRDDGGAGGVARRGGKGVPSRSGLEEEEREEDEDLGPDPGLVGVGIDAERLEQREDGQDNGPAVVQAEGEVDEELGGEGALARVGVDDKVDLGDGAGYEERGNKRGNVPPAEGEPDERRVEQAEEGEAVLDAVDDDGLATLGELVDDHAEEEDVDQRPDPEGVRRGRDVGVVRSG